MAFGFIKDTFNRLAKWWHGPVWIVTSEEKLRMTLTNKWHGAFETSVSHVMSATPADKGPQKPEDKLWDVVDELFTPDEYGLPGAYDSKVTKMTYEKMLQALRAHELKMARDAGIEGTDEQVAAKRLPFLAANNVLRVPLPVPAVVKPAAAAAMTPS